MLSAIKDIGKWQIAKSGKQNLDVLIKEPNFKNGGKLVLIKINLDEKRFEGVELENYDSSKIHKYFFRGGVSQGPGYVRNEVLSDYYNLETGFITKDDRSIIIW